MIITIDTGIDGSIDQDQWDWLSMVSAEPVPKILLTGKPLVVNAALEPCWVGGRPKRGEHRPSVWELVNDPANSYVATIGGDAHNFQCPSPGSPTRSSAPGNRASAGPADRRGR